MSIKELIEELTKECIQHGDLPVVFSWSKGDRKYRVNDVIGFVDEDECDLGEKVIMIEGR